jgi:hypothetical protein
MFNSLVQNFRLDSSVSLQQRARMLALTALVLGFIIAANAGCVIGVGRGCVAGHGGLRGHCHDCDGLVGRPLVYGPLNRLRNVGHRLACGAGCSEVYVGEWASTPPDACDPCGGGCCGVGPCGGGVLPCRPFCWHPGSLLSSLRWSGRFYDGMPYGDCGCCDEFGDDYFYEEGMIESPVYHQQLEGHSSHSGHSGCSHCSRTAVSGGRTPSSSRMAESPQSGRYARTSNYSPAQAGFTPQSRMPGGSNPRPSQTRPAVPRSDSRTLVR